MMKSTEAQRNWDEWGRKDPLWAISTIDGKEGGNWDLEEFFATGVEDVGEVMKHVEAKGFDLADGVALDFGCGVGRLSQGLAAHFKEVKGVDIAPSMIEKARNYNRHGDAVAYHVNDASDLKLFDSASFDFVFSRSVLQHIRPHLIKAYLREFARLVKPGGLIAFQLHTQPIEPTIRQRLLRLLPPELVHPYRDVKKWLLRRPTMELYGLDIEEVTELMETAGVRFLSLMPDRSGSGAWRTYYYFFTKDSD
jgi:ubiquinone/menaquinone biosynthesis C-methylase UbiE